jgi:hypothetical protein
VTCGLGPDQVSVSGQPPASPLTVHGGGGGDTIIVMIGPSSGYSGLTIDGGGGFDYLLLQAAGATTSVFPGAGPNAGTVVAAFSGGAASVVGFTDIDVLFRTA